MYVREATFDDIPALMDIFARARQIMRASGNLHQWNDSYPSEEIVRNDIDRKVCRLLCEEDGSIIATMAFIPGPDPTYAWIYEGSWPDDCPYYVIHRIAVKEPGHDAAAQLFDWAFGMLGSLMTPQGRPEGIRIDTHRDNVIMHHLLKKYGFTPCGVILLANGDPRDAYFCKFAESRLNRQHNEPQTGDES